MNTEAYDSKQKTISNKNINYRKRGKKALNKKKRTEGDERRIIKFCCASDYKNAE